MNTNNTVTTTDKSTITIIVNDDEMIMREMMAAMLTNEGYTVVGTNGLAKSLEAIRAHADSVRILVTDKDGSDGIELAQAVRKEFPSVRILMVSGGLSKEGTEAQFVDAVLAKPFRHAPFIETIRQFQNPRS